MDFVELRGIGEPNLFGTLSVDQADSSDFVSLLSVSYLSPTSVETQNDFGLFSLESILNPNSLDTQNEFGLLFLGSPLSFSSYTLNIENGLPIGTELGYFSVSLDGEFSYSLVSGLGSDDNGYFTIVDNNLLIYSVLDKNTYLIRVRAEQGDYAYEQMFILNAIDTVNNQGFFDGAVGSFTISATASLLGLQNNDYAGDLACLFLISQQGLSSQESLGSLYVDGFIGLPGIYDSGYGSLILSMLYNLGGIPSQEGLNPSLAINYFGFFQPVVWNVDKIISVGSAVVWNVGLGVEKWYRVEGCCIFPTKQGSGYGISGPSFAGGCDISNFQSSDSKCIGASGKQRFIQNILATSVADVCRQLNQYNMKWQVCSIQVYSNPAGPALDSCNTLTEVPFAGYPECIEVSIHTDTLVRISYSDRVYSSFQYSGSGGLNLEGNSSFSFSQPGLSLYSYNGHGGLSVGGEAFVESSWEDLLNVDLNFSFNITFIEAVQSFKQPTATLVGASSTISTLCGSCTSMPSTMYCYTNLDRSYLLSRLIGKNSINFPKYFPLYYSTLLKSWTSNYQFSGYGDSGIENWNFVLSWSCLNQIGGESSSPYWKYSMFINRSLSSKDFDTRINVTFPPQELCRLINNLSVDLSFSLNTITGYVDNSTVDVTDLVSISDKIGVFKDATWTADPWLDVRISRSAVSPQYQTVDLSPLLP